VTSWTCVRRIERRELQVEPDAAATCPSNGAPFDGIQLAGQAEAGEIFLGPMSIRGKPVRRPN
jgi:hypothetical protein